MIPVRVHPVDDGSTAEACAVDKSCADSGCGCSTTTQPSPTPDAPTGTAASSRRGLKAGLLAIACAVACLAVPLAVGGVAALSGALAGEWWLVAGVLVLAAVGSVVLVRRRRTTGQVC